MRRLGRRTPNRLFNLHSWGMLSNTNQWWANSHASWGHGWKPKGKHCRLVGYLDKNMVNIACERSSLSQQAIAFLWPSTLYYLRHQLSIELNYRRSYVSHPRYLGSWPAKYSPQESGQQTRAVLLLCYSYINPAVLVWCLFNRKMVVEMINDAWNLKLYEMRRENCGYADTGHKLMSSMHHKHFPLNKKSKDCRKMSFLCCPASSYSQVVIERLPRTQNNAEDEKSMNKRNYVDLVSPEELVHLPETWIYHHIRVAVDYHKRNLKYAISRAEHPVTTSNKESMYNGKGNAHTEAY